MIIKRKDGYHVVSGEHLDAEGNKKNLGGPYGTWGEAKKRLDQVEMFKAMDKSGTKRKSK